MRPIYFDYNATTPLDPEVREAMTPYLDGIFGNPSSVHQVGQRARSLLDDARYRTAALWRCKPSEVVFTSGGTESNNLAVFGACRLRAQQGRGRHLAVSAVEHPAVLHCFHYLEKREGFEVTYIDPDETGTVQTEAVQNAIRSDTVLVSVMAANNEVGAVQPVAEIGRFCRERGILFHTDAVQWFGKLSFESIHQFEADLVSCCAHKFHGPKGAGALFIRSPLLPDPILFGGGHENERRAGTENLAAIQGLVEAMQRFVPKPVFQDSHLLPLTDELRAVIGDLEGVDLLGPATSRLNNTVAFTVKGADGMSLIAGLDMEGICASSGSACSSGSIEPSHVLTAMGLPKTSASSLVRFSLGRESTQEETRRVLEATPGILERVRSAQ